MPREKPANPSVVVGTSIGQHRSGAQQRYLDRPPTQSGSTLNPPTAPRAYHASQAGSSTGLPSQPAQPAGAWANHNNTANLRNSVYANAAGSRAGSLLVPNRGLQAPSSLAGHMNNVTLHNSGSSGQANVWNPSVGPTPSQVSMMSMAVWKDRMTQSQFGGSHAGYGRRAVYNEVCRMSNYSKKNFKKGDIIAVPFHEPCLNANLQLPHRDWTMTYQGPVYSKRRMVIVLWSYQRDLFCLPMYTHNGTGLANKHDVEHEYAAIKDVGRVQAARGIYPAVEVTSHKKPMDENSFVHITGGIRVSCNDDITWSGRVTKESYMALVSLWERLMQRARNEPWIN